VINLLCIAQFWQQTFAWQPLQCILETNRITKPRYRMPTGQQSVKTSVRRSRLHRTMTQWRMPCLVIEHWCASARRYIVCNGSVGHRHFHTSLFASASASSNLQCCHRDMKQPARFVLLLR